MHLRVAVALAACGLAGCAHKTSAELSAQTGEESAMHTTHEPEPVRMQSTPVGAPPADPVASSVPVRPEGHVPAACPFRCAVAGPGRTSRDIPDAEEAKLRAAFASTMDGLRQCAWYDWSKTDNRRRSPILNLRFDGQGELVDVGVDSTGFDAVAEQCMHNLIRGGGTAWPPTKHEGPVTIRCSERCDARKPAWVTPK